MTAYLLPGIITITPRARYYAFYAWLLVEYARLGRQRVSLAKFIKRREQILVLANLAWSATSDDNPLEGGLLGSVKLRRHWRKHKDAATIPLGVDDYLKAQHGGFDIYAGPMRTLALTRLADSGALEVLPKGQGLAASFADAIRHTRYYRRRSEFDTSQSIPRDVLEEYGACCHLGGLADSPDCLPTLEALFAFDAAPLLPPQGSESMPVGNMKGTLALILDMIDQAEGPLGDEGFRQAAAYGSCADYASYCPSNELRPVLAQWQMFQLREYYVYALYCLWVYFLHWLRLEGPKTFKDFRIHLSDEIDLTVPATALGITLPERRPEEWSITSWMHTLLEVSGVTGTHWESRCASFARRSYVPPNEQELYSLLSRRGPQIPSEYLGTAWLLLSSLFLRLSGIRHSIEEEAWYWARFGGGRRRSMARFVADIAALVEAGESLLNTWTWLFRDYIVAQHVISALEKWRYRKANTFHFNYDRGIFEWVRDGRTGFSGSRFRQACDMLGDLGLFQTSSEDGNRPELTELGRETLERALEACRG